MPDLPAGRVVRSNDVRSNVVRSNDEWRTILSPLEYHVLREKGTERPWTGEYTDTKTSGTYACRACGAELFRSEGKFDSHCGWPAFDRAAPGVKIDEHMDTSHGMVRTEVTCPRCASHLGHLFDDGPTDTGMRYCINSVCLTLKPDAKEK